MFGCQQVLIHTNKENQAIIEYLCAESNKVFNCAIYYARQIYFKANRTVGKSELLGEIKRNIHFKAMYSQAAQQTCLSVLEAFKSFKELNRLFKKGELANQPKPPKYRKGGLCTVSYPSQALQLENSWIRIPLGRQVKAWFGIDSFPLKLPANLQFEAIRELRILPRNRCFYAEFVYEVESINTGLNQQNALGIDPGMDNWLTCVSNLGTSFIIDGKHLKSLNRWYNKKVSTIKEGKPQGFWSNKLAHLTEKRNLQMRDGVNKAARLVLNHCLENDIGTIVFGWNEGQKQESSLGRKNNQKWVQVPTAKLKERISQLCQQYGINFVETEESYTSQSSFVDDDFLPKYGEKPENWKPLGKRVKRGLYRTAFNWYINADANAAANILKKVSGTLNLVLNELSRVSLTTPQRFFLWSAKRIQRNVVLTRPSVSA
ncbi:transposase [Phormidium sp. LEGE 05292]|nr:transposase [Phormidium sp. LEGE 05292]